MPEKLDNAYVIDSTDHFSAHFNYEMPESVAESLAQFQSVTVENIATKSFGRLHFTKTCAISRKPNIVLHGELNKLKVKKSILQQVKQANPLKAETALPLIPTQLELFQLLDNYCDIYVPNVPLNKQEEIQFVYALHALNHALKNRSKVLRHNAKLKESESLDDLRDQGLTRPKILILVPFRESARRIIEIWIDLLFSGDREFVTNKKRFFDEFSSNDDEEASKSMKKRPSDFEELFKGNIDDCFRVGIGVAKKSLKLFVEFYTADILLASPLGLRYDLK